MDSIWCYIPDSLKGIIQVPVNWITDPFKGIIQFPGYPGIGGSIIGIQMFFKKIHSCDAFISILFLFLSPNIGM